RLHDGPRLAQQAHATDVRLPELERPDAEPVVLGRLVLLDVAARLERREQPKNVVLVKLQPLAELSDAELVGLAVELLDDVERMRDGANDVVALLATDHGRCGKTF